jgi:hypothetical protein
MEHGGFEFCQARLYSGNERRAWRRNANALISPRPGFRPNFLDYGLLCSGDNDDGDDNDNPTTSRRQRNSTSSAIFIQGASGIGKSVLVDSFWEHVTSTEVTATATQCLLCRGTFEEGRSDSDPFWQSMPASICSFNL